MYVEYTAEGTWYRTIMSERLKDGRDRIDRSVQMEQEVTVTISHDMPTGHVNLEAYCPSRAPDRVAEDVQHEANEELAEGEIEIDSRTIETRISGTADAWVTQARRWVSERPSKDVYDALKMFAGYDETSGAADALNQYPEEHLRSMEPHVPER